MDYWIWAVVVFAIGILFLVLDFFIPSGGVLAVMSAIAILLGIVMGFLSGPSVGVSLLVGAGVIIPTFIAVAIKFWPQTPLGRLILIQTPENPDDVLPDDELTRSLKNLIGRHGRAKCVMLPSGIVEIDHRNYDAVSEGLPIEAGQTVEVIAVRTNRIVVRLVEAGAEEPQSGPKSETDILSRPIESLGLDPLHDPLA